MSPITGVIALVIIALLVFRRQIGLLRTAALLVTIGAAGLLEHPGFSIINALQIQPFADQSIIPPQPKIHFFMAGIYSLIAYRSFYPLPGVDYYEGVNQPDTLSSPF